MVLFVKNAVKMTYPVAEIQQIISEEHQSRLINMRMFNMTDDEFFAFA